MILQLMTFTISTSIYPGNLISKKYSFINISYETVIVVLIFNTFDLLGRILASYPIYSNKQIFTLSILRLLCIPLTICILNSKSGIFNEYWILVTVVVVSGFTHGYGVNALNYLSTLTVESKDDKKLIGYYINLSICFGSLLGSVLALAY